MLVKNKLELTEERINETRGEMRRVQRMLASLRGHQEYKNIASKEEIKKIDEVEELLREIEFRINDIVFDME